MSPSWRGVRAGVGVAVLAVAGFASAGCSMSYQLGSLFGKSEERAAASETGRVETTGSTGVSSISLASDRNGGISEADLAAARAAATAMLASGAKDTSRPWQNPDTGARGMITPITSAYTQDGFTCRDFLASIVHDKAETWLQGEACRVHHGKWVVRTMKPWKRA